MTLTMRSLSTFKERVYLQLKSGRKYHRALSDEALFSLIEEIKKRYTAYGSAFQTPPQKGPDRLPIFSRTSDRCVAS